MGRLTQRFQGVTFSRRRPSWWTSSRRFSSSKSSPCTWNFEGEQAIGSGEFPDQAAVARHLGLPRARLTQPLDLTLLAPDIQERILGLDSVDGGPSCSTSLAGSDRWPGS